MNSVLQHRTKNLATKHKRQSQMNTFRMEFTSTIKRGGGILKKGKGLSDPRSVAFGQYDPKGLLGNPLLLSKLGVEEDLESS